METDNPYDQRYATHESYWGTKTSAICDRVIELITTGLYSQIRNPMLLGVGILLNSISLLLIFTPLFICLNILYLRTIEEKEMEKRFGKQYLKYKKNVPMFISRFGKRK